MIAINGRYLTQRVTGVQRFGREVLAQMLALPSGGALDVLLPPGPAPIEPLPQRASTRSVGMGQGHVWEQFSLAGAEREKPLLNLCNTAPLARRRQVIVLHDAMVAAMPENFTPLFRNWYRVMICAYTRSAAQLATVSEFSAREISRHFGIPIGRMAIIPESGEHILRTPADYSVLQRLQLEQDGYFLAVSSSAANKNFAAVVKAARHLQRRDFKFVIVGGGNAAVFNGSGDTPEGAVRAGYVSDGELRALYERAACFIYPSLYEGFGLPPLEAMCCGCPVIVSNTASLPEVCGDAALYCDPYDPHDIARVLARLLDNRNLREQLRARGLQRAQLWKWRSAALRVGELLDNLAH
jgi:glycosyltransferase involved in cell wall biosynthesis